MGHEKTRSGEIIQSNMNRVLRLETALRATRRRASSADGVDLTFTLKNSWTGRRLSEAPGRYVSSKSLDYSHSPVREKRSNINKWE
ncbi:hypothetical protein KQX54_021856 [Cotesia glomerata]|uniref:Uncharacterized protein n=1 Tax=Cotesia glomerata TaxID=32391 RepID=A0AAV7IX42_COTGL|nr:hypothetical protein KQX54_021856 [Cotesia glomerata]